MQSLPRLLAAIASALVLVVISPPLNLHFLHWFAFLPLLWALREGELRTNLKLAYLAGFVGVAALFSWLLDTVVIFAALPWPVAALVLLAFGALFGLPYALVFGLVHPLRRRIGAAWVFAIPAVQVSVELLGPALFPYFQGVSQYRTQWVWQTVSLTGILGLSYLVMLTNCALAELIYRRREGRGQPWGVLAATGLLWLSCVGFGAWRYPRVEAAVAEMPRLRISQIQQNVDMLERRDGAPRDAMLSWVRKTSELHGQDIDLVVWPEGATPYDPRGARVGKLMGNLTRSLDAPIIFGGGYAEAKRDPASGREYTERRNSMYLMGTDGQVIDRYDKMVPLPFGEYIPFSDTFPILREWIQGVGDFQAGERPVTFELSPFDVGQPVRFITPVCYEAILSGFVRERAAGANLLVNVTNDGWFGDTAAPHQHAMLSAVRAMELGVPMYRLGYTGVSFVVSPSGQITHETAPFTEVVRVIEAPVGRVPTIYSRVGDLFGWLCVLGAALASGLAWRRRRLT